jgi:hypothetical protein
MLLERILCVPHTPMLVPACVSVRAYMQGAKAAKVVQDAQAKADASACASRIMQVRRPMSMRVYRRCPRMRVHVRHRMGLYWMS